MADKAAKPAQEDDLELDELLDDALEDLKKPRPGQEPSEDTQDWTRDFLSRRNLGRDLNDGNVTPPNSFVDPSMFRQAFERGMFAEGGGDSAKPLEEALRMMQAEAEGKVTDPKDLESLLSGMKLDPAFADPGQADFMPMMEQMMESLLSKDVLYPAIRDLADRFPDWLADHREELTDGQYEKYNQQCEIARRICHEFEKGDDKDNKNRREEVMGLMQAMQALGNPPKDLVGDVGGPPGFPGFDGEFPKELPEQCKMS